MMLRLLLGSGGSGKTTAIYQAAAEKSRSGTGDSILRMAHQPVQGISEFLQRTGPRTVPPADRRRMGICGPYRQERKQISVGR